MHTLASAFVSFSEINYLRVACRMHNSNSVGSNLLLSGLRQVG